MSKTRQPTDAERERRRQAARDRLERAARELLSSDGWARWIRVRASTNLGRYSLRNQWILSSEGARRGITPTHVAGFRAWLTINRVVIKGEKAMYILAPMSVKQRDATGEDTGEKRVFYRSVAVFDASQTAALPGTEPIPLTPPRQPITGDSHARLLDPLTQLAAELGYAVRELPLNGGADGWCDSTYREIVVNALLPATPASACWSTNARMPSAFTTPNTAANGQKSWWTASHTSCCRRSVSTSAARASPTSLAGAKTGRSTRSASTPRRSTSSHGASRTR
jgi:hypothetical protein